MISDLILRYRNLDIALKTAVRLNSSAQVAELDEQITDLWEQILLCAPETDEQAELLVNFLFSELSVIDGKEGKFGQVRRKIVDIVRHPRPIEQPQLSTYADRIFQIFGVQKHQAPKGPQLSQNSTHERPLPIPRQGSATYNSLKSEKW